MWKWKIWNSNFDLFLKALYFKAPLFFFECLTISYVFESYFLKCCKLNYTIVSIMLFDSLKFVGGWEDVAVSSCVWPFWIMNTALVGNVGMGTSVWPGGRAIVLASARAPRDNQQGKHASEPQTHFQHIPGITNSLDRHGCSIQSPGQDRQGSLQSLHTFWNFFPNPTFGGFQGLQPYMEMPAGPQPLFPGYC